MSWFRVGDTAATDPRVLALNDPRDPLVGPAAFGFCVTLGTLSANQFTDYVIHPGFLALAGGAAAPKLLKRCIAAGLIIPLGGRGAARRWKLIDTAPELFHIRLQAEVAWEKQQRADTRNPALQEPVLLRDGDACRWCGIPVQPNDTRSRRGRQFDHLRPGLPARGPEGLVVACRGCNGERGRDRQEHPDETAEQFAARWAGKLLQPPRQLFFVRSTMDWLTEAGHTIPPGSVIADRAPVARNTATPTTTPTPDGATHPANAGVAAPPRTDQPAITGQDAPVATHPAPAGVAATESRNDHRSPTDRSGAGRARAGSGSGRVAPASRASPAPPSSPAPSPRRTRRGRRRPRSTTEESTTP